MRLDESFHTTYGRTTASKRRKGAWISPDSFSFNYC
jgi:hypothetical protein